VAAILYISYTHFLNDRGNDFIPLLVREARLKEIKAEVLNSEKLKVRIPIYNADEVCMLVVILPPNLFLHLVFISVGSLCLM
jgi:hypothetical protein